MLWLLIRPRLGDDKTMYGGCQVDYRRYICQGVSIDDDYDVQGG